jgi:hypothetical protein
MVDSIFTAPLKGASFERGHAFSQGFFSMGHYLSRYLGSALLTVLAVGCSSYHKVEGTVTGADGSPLAGATVTFMPTAEGGQSASGITDSNGKFKLTSPTSDKGIQKGTYKVIITKASAEEAFTSEYRGDPTKAMEEYWRKNKGTATATKGAPASMPKSSLNPRYSKPDTTPFTVSVPVDGAVNLKLEN